MPKQIPRLQLEKTKREFLKAEKRYASRIGLLMDKQVSALDIKDLKNLDFDLATKSFLAQAKKANEEMYSLGIKHVANELKNLIKISPSFAMPALMLSDMEIIDTLTEHTITSLQYIAEDIKPALIDTLQEGRRLGEGQRKLAARVQAVWGGERSRATAFARTEGNELYNQAHRHRYEESGVVQYVQFRAVMDQRTTVICQMLNETIWRIDDPDIIQPPLHFNCRSRLVPYFGKYPGERDYTDLSDGTTITPKERDQRLDKIDTFKEKYWQVPWFGRPAIREDVSREDITKYTQPTPPEEKEALLTEFKQKLAQHPRVMQEIEKWDKKVELGVTSKTENTVGGEYTPERKALHEEIINQFWKDTQGEQTAVFFGGPSGSGKSKLLDYVPDKENYVYINNDEIKKLLPEYNGYNANFLHEEARDITEALKFKALENKASFILDGTLRDVGKGQEMFMDAKTLGYRVKLLSTNIPLSEALDRTFTRATGRGLEGRYVPPETVIRNTDKINAAQFELIKHADEGTIFDSSVKKGERYKPIIENRR